MERDNRNIREKDIWVERSCVNTWNGKKDKTFIDSLHPFVKGKLDVKRFIRWAGIIADRK